MDIPDPYVKITCQQSLEESKRTRHFEDEINPVWNECFTFHIPNTPGMKATLHVIASIKYCSLK